LQNLQSNKDLEGSNRF